MIQQEPIPGSDVSHAEFDTNFIRALGNEGYSRWYLRPKIESTTQTIDHVERYIRSSVENCFGELPGKRLVPHLSFLITQGAANVHLESDTLENVLLTLRHAMLAIAIRGMFHVEDTEDPLYKYATQRTVAHARREGGSISGVKIMAVDATKAEVSAAKRLIGTINKLDDVSCGPLSNLVLTHLPMMASLNKDRCIEFALDLRRKIHVLIDGRTQFDEFLRKECIDLISDHWNEIRPAEEMEHQKEEIQEEAGGGDPLYMEPTEFIRQYLDPVSQDPTRLRKRIASLEELSFTNVLENNQANCRILSATWVAVFPNMRLPICDAPGAALAYLATLASAGSLAKFKEMLGPVPQFTLPGPVASASQRPAL